MILVCGIIFLTNSKIDGLFQCLTYLEGQKDIIRGWLKTNVDVRDYSDDDTCVIHFRGGEYLITASWLEPKFYEDARDRMLEHNPKHEVRCCDR